MSESETGEIMVKLMGDKRDRGNFGQKLGRSWAEVGEIDLDQNVPSDLRMNKPYLIVIR